MRRLLVALSCVLLYSTAASAQTVTDGRAWVLITLQGRVSKSSRWRWAVDGIVRSRDGVSTLDVTSVRPTILYGLTSHTSVGGGYTFVTNYPATGGTTREQRVFGLVTWSAPAGGGTLSWRVRVEDRLIEANSGPLWRARPYLRFSRPFHANGRLSWVTSDEFDLHLNTTTKAPRGVDQNRAYGGVSMAWNPRVRTEIGYLNQFQPGHGAANKMNHVVSTTVLVSF